MFGSTYRFMQTPYSLSDSSEDESWREYSPEETINVWHKRCISDQSALRKAIRSIKRRLRPWADCDDDFHLYKLVNGQWKPIPLPQIYISSAMLYGPRWLQSRKYHINWDRMST